MWLFKFDLEIGFSMIYFLVYFLDNKILLKFLFYNEFFKRFYYLLNHFDRKNIKLSFQKR